MKNLFFACGLLAVITMCAPSVNAQTAPSTAPPAPGAPPPGGPAGRPMLTPDQRAQKQTEMMQKNLSLTPDQVTKVKQINLDFQTQMDQLRTNTSVTPQDKHAQMKTLRDKHDADIKAVLTPEQQAKLEQMQQNRGPQAPGATPAPPKQ